MGIRVIKILLEPVQLHLQPAHQLEQLRNLSLDFLSVLAVATPFELVTSAILRLVLTLEYLDGMDGVFSSDHLNLASIAHLHCDRRVAHGTVGAALANWWAPEQGR
jgi:hypothetical protein